MILGIIGLGILTGLTAGVTALIGGYSIIMALWFYTLFGFLAITSGLLLSCTTQILMRFWQRHYAYSN